MRPAESIEHCGSWARGRSGPSTFVDDLGADSLSLVELVLAFEDAFEIDIPDSDAERIHTVQDALDCVGKHVASVAPPQV